MRLEQWRKLLEPKQPDGDLFIDWDKIQYLATSYCFCPAGEKVGFGPARKQDEMTDMECNEMSLAARNKYRENKLLWDLGNQFSNEVVHRDYEAMIRVLTQIEECPL